MKEYFRKVPEAAVFVLALAVLNIGLVLGWGVMDRFIFLPGVFVQGEWWRIITHPFVHVGIYHLLLDAGAFFMLYGSLREHRIEVRLSYVLSSLLGSLVVAWYASPMFPDIGLCGLSAVGHGLLAVLALDMICYGQDDPLLRRTGKGVLLLVLGKSIVEAVTGTVVFSGLHLGSIGTPVAASHLGGVLGGVVMYGLRHNFRYWKCQCDGRKACMINT